MGDRAPPTQFTSCTYPSLFYGKALLCLILDSFIEEGYRKFPVCDTSACECIRYR